MIGLYTALIGMVMLIVSLILLFSVAFIIAVFERFQMWIWRKITSPQGPPWKRNHIGLNHVSTTANTKNMKVGTLVLPNYKARL